MAELKSIQDQLDKASRETVCDTVEGSRTVVPYDKHRIPVEGAPEAKSDRLKRRYERLCAEIQDEIAELEDRLEGVPDDEIRGILRMYYVFGMTQEEIGVELGYSRSFVAMRLKRFFGGLNL